MQPNRMHESYREGKLPSKKELVRTFVRLKTPDFDDKVICQVDARKVMTLEKALSLEPKWADLRYKHQYRSDNLRRALEQCEGYQFFDMPEIVLYGEVLRAEPRNLSNEYYFGVKANLKMIREHWKHECARRLEWEIQQRRESEGYSQKEIAKMIELVKGSQSRKESEGYALSNALFGYKHSFNQNMRRYPEAKLIIITRLGNKRSVPNDSILLPFKQTEEPKCK